MQILSIQKEMAPERVEFAPEYHLGSAFIHGEYCPIEEAKIPLYDMGFLQADTVYEKATVSNGRFFRLADHLDRFENSCRKFGLRNPYSLDETTDILSKLVALTGLKSAGVYWCVTRGFIKDISDRNNPDAFENRFYAMASAYESMATDEDRRQGMELIVSKKYIRTPAKAIDPTAKNTNWMDMKLSLFEAREQGKAMSVLTDAEGYLTETPGANIFIVKNGELFTPDRGCLEGITRKSALELAKICSIPIHVEPVHAEQILEADEAFMTSSAGGVMPIRSVDSIILGDRGAPGCMTTKLHNLYWEKMWEGWHGTDIDYSAVASSVAQAKALISE